MFSSIQFENISSYLPSLIFIPPLLWGIFEFRQFRFHIGELKDSADTFNKKIDDISQGNLKDYPLFLQIKKVSKKLNKIF